MKLPKQIQIEKACSADASRAVITQVYLQRGQQGPSPDRLLATNGRIAAIVPVLASGEDKEGFIQPDAIKAARKGAGKLEVCEFSAGDVCTMPDGQTFGRLDLGSYPNIDAVIPKDDAKFTIGIDPLLLLSLAQAIGSERGVVLEVIGDQKAIRVRPCNNPRAETPKGSHAGFVPACPDAMGVIMPLATE